MTERKITKKEMYGAIKGFLTATGVEAIYADEEVTITLEDAIAFCEGEIGALEKKAAKAKETQAKKRAESDALKETLAGMLTDEFATIADFVAQFDEAEEVTPQKVSSRLSALAKEGVAEKQELSVETANGSKVRRMAYKLATVTE